LALRLQMSTPRRNAISTALTNSPRKSHEPNDVCRESDINMWKIARSDRKATIGMCPDEFKIKIVHRLFAARNGSMEANIIKRKNCERRYITNNYIFSRLDVSVFIHFACVNCGDAIGIAPAREHDTISHRLLNQIIL
jgi:hypothetical protein